MLLILHFRWLKSSTHSFICFTYLFSFRSFRGKYQRYSAPQTAPVTVVTSVPWERERDITENISVMGTPSLQPFLKTYWLTPVNDWPIVAKHANMTSSRGSINAAPATITSESDTERRLAERAAITVMSRSRSQGTEVMTVTGAFPFELSRDITENFSIMGTLFNPAVREATGSLYQLHSAIAFPPITALVGRAHSW